MLEFQPQNGRLQDDDMFILAAMASRLFISLNGRGGYCTPIAQGNGSPLGALSVPGCLDSDGSDVAAGVPEHKLHAGFPWWHLLRRKGSWLGKARLSMPVTRPISATLLAPSHTDLDQTIRATSRNPFCVPSHFSRVSLASSIHSAGVLGERIPHPSSSLVP